MALDIQTDIQLLLTAVSSVAAAVAAVYSAKNHGIGTSNAAKLDAVKVSTDGNTAALNTALAVSQAQTNTLQESISPTTPLQPPTKV